MDDFIRKVIEGNGILPSEVCLQSFNLNFENAVNVEWFHWESHYEAIFYINNQEHIAIFSLTGELKEYSKNLSSDYIPEPIKIKALLKGEIMNSVMKNKGNSLEYEMIIRDKQLKRYIQIYSDTGNLMEEKML